MIITACTGKISDIVGGDANESRKDLPPIAAVRAREVLRDEVGIKIAQVVIVSHTQKTSPPIPFSTPHRQHSPICYS